MHALYFVYVHEGKKKKDFFSFFFPLWKYDRKMTVVMQYSCNTEDQKFLTSMCPMNTYFRMVKEEKRGERKILQKFHCDIEA